MIMCQCFSLSFDSVVYPYRYTLWCLNLHLKCLQICIKYGHAISFILYIPCSNISFSNAYLCIQMGTENIFLGRRCESIKYITKSVASSSAQKFFIKTFFKPMSSQVFWVENTCLHFFTCQWMQTKQDKTGQNKTKQRCVVIILLLKYVGFYSSMLSLSVFTS